MRNHFFLLLMIFAGSQCLAQRVMIKGNFNTLDPDVQKILSHRIYQIKAYKYEFVNDKFSNEGVLAEQKQYTPKGLINYEYTTIDHELSYLLAKMKKTVVTYSEDMMTDAGVQTLQAGTDYMMNLYELPSRTSFFFYNDSGKLHQQYEKYIIGEEDSVMNIIGYVPARNPYGPDNSDEQVTTLGTSWIVSNSRDLFLNSFLTEPGTYIYSYSAHYDKQNHVIQDVCVHPARSVGNTYKYDEKGDLIARKQGAFTKQSFVYDDQHRMTSTEMEDIFGITRITYKYDANSNLAEIERINIKPEKKYSEGVSSRYKHSFYTYNDKNLLAERIDRNQTGEILYKIVYKYWFDGDYSEVIADRIPKKMEEWLKKGKYESTTEYEQRTSEAGKAKQMDVFKDEIINELGLERYNLQPLTLTYDADKEVFTITFKELNSVNIYVPRLEAEEFEKNGAKYTMFPVFGLGNEGLILKSITVKSTELNKEYHSR